MERSSARRCGALIACAVALAAAAAGCGGGSDDGDGATTPTTADVRQSAPPRPSAETLAVGRRVYDEHCASCHGLDGRPHAGTTGEHGPSFDDVELRDRAYVRRRVDWGGYGMQSFTNEIGERGKRAVVAFVTSVSGRNVPERGRATDEQMAAGRQVFDSACRNCHRLEGRGATAPRDRVTFLGNDLDLVRPSPQRIRHMVRNGDWWMPALRRRLTPQQIDDVTAYLNEVAGRGPPAEGGTSEPAP